MWWLNLGDRRGRARAVRTGRPGPAGAARSPPAVVGPGGRLPRGRELRGPPAVPAQRPLLLARRPSARVRTAVRDRGRRSCWARCSDPRPRLRSSAGWRRSSWSSTSRSSRSRHPSPRWSCTSWPRRAPRSTPTRGLAVLLGTQASALITVMLIGLAISLSEGVLRLNTVGQMLAMDFVVTATNTSLGLAGAIVVSTDARAIPLLAVPGAGRLPRLSRVSDGAPAARAARVPLRGHAHAVALARDGARARGPAGALAGVVPRRDGRDRAVRLRGQPAAADHAGAWGVQGGHGADGPGRRRGAARPRGRGPTRTPHRAAVRLRAAAALPRRPHGDRRDGRRAAGRGPGDRDDHARQPLWRDPFVHRRGPEALRDARQQRERRAAIRPPRAGRPPAARAAGAAAPPGVPRSRSPTWRTAACSPTR